MAGGILNSTTTTWRANDLLVPNAPFNLVVRNAIPDSSGITWYAGQILIYTLTAATITSGNAETYVLVNGQTLLVSVNGGAVQTATFNTGDFSDIGAATAAEVAAVINTDINGVVASGATGSVVITTDLAGAEASIEITGGTATALGFSTEKKVSGGSMTVAKWDGTDQDIDDIAGVLLDDITFSTTDNTPVRVVTQGKVLGSRILPNKATVAAAGGTAYAVERALEKRGLIIGATRA